ncbi:MAG: DUF4281 domain-containing protein [Alphaproteobacteria bacterium]|nr:DUF4281 domain-containing protein [Alphaproteobacteria bacterium]
MSYSFLFDLVTFATMPLWGLLLVAPTHAVTHRLIHSGLAPGALGVLYIGMLAVGAVSPFGEPGLANVIAMFQHPEIMVLGWVHYLAFDLFVGGWIARDAAARGVSRLWAAPCLVLTWMLGPSGLVVWFALRGLLALRAPAPRTSAG